MFQLTHHKNLNPLEVIEIKVKVHLLILLDSLNAELDGIYSGGSTAKHGKTRQSTGQMANHGRPPFMDEVSDHGS